jgi:CheY-like chemotaxis protein
MGTLDGELQKTLKEYLSHNSILIVDSVSSARVNLASALTKMGAPRQKMSLVGSLAEARDEIQKLKPKLVFSDFMIGSESGLDLLQDQKVAYTKDELKKAVFVLVTSNASQSTVARAAEEDVDTFIIKPYTMDTLTKALASSIQVKLNPSRYLELIELGKEELFKNNFDQAIDFFEDAMGEHDQPTLACFYAGQAEFMKAAISSAASNYDKGLSYNKIHYKCLVGMYDLLMAQKKYHEAYDIIRRLSQYFPANPKRLSSVLRLAILTEHFEDMEGYYQIYLRIPERNDDLIKYMCSALVVTGKYYLRTKNRSRAVKLFEAASVSAGGRTNFTTYAIEALVNFNILNEAEKFLERLRTLAPASKDFQISKFLISTLQDDLIGSIQQGRNLIREGIETPAVYEKLIAQSKTGQYHEEVENLLEVASKKWPDRIPDFIFARDHAPPGDGVAVAATATRG